MPAPKTLKDHWEEGIARIDADLDDLKMSRAEIARDLGMSRVTFSRWGRKVPATVATMARVQEALAVKRQQRAARR